MLALCLFGGHWNACVASDDWGDVFGDSGGDQVKRPVLSGWHSWKYNRFSSFDQFNLRLQREFTGKQRFTGHFRALRYEEDDNKSWKVFAGETTFFQPWRKFDFLAGLLVETLGSGDKISWVDKINSRRYYNGLANDYNRDKKEVPGLRATYFFDSHYNIVFHALPYFQASEMASIHSQWATDFQKSLAWKLLTGAQFVSREDDSGINEQYHLAVNTKFRKYELRYHYFHLKERLPVIDRVAENQYRWAYPRDVSWAVDGNVQLDEQTIMRFEGSYGRRKTFATFQDGVIGPRFQSDVYNLLLGTDRNFPGNFYGNLQLLMSHIVAMKAPTPLQTAPTEWMATLQLRQSFRRETLFIEFNGVHNLSTGEYMLTPQIHLHKGDFLKLIGGVHINGKGTDSLGPIGQFDRNNTPFFETEVMF